MRLKWEPVLRAVRDLHDGSGMMTDTEQMFASNFENRDLFCDLQPSDALDLVQSMELLTTERGAALEAHEKGLRTMATAREYAEKDRDQNDVFVVCNTKTSPVKLSIPKYTELVVSQWSHKTPSNFPNGPRNLSGLRKLVGTSYDKKEVDELEDVNEKDIVGRRTIPWRGRAFFLEDEKVDLVVPKMGKLLHALQDPVERVEATSEEELIYLSASGNSSQRRSLNDELKVEYGYRTTFCFDEEEKKWHFDTEMWNCLGKRHQQRHAAHPVYFTLFHKTRKEAEMGAKKAMNQLVIKPGTSKCDVAEMYSPPRVTEVAERVGLQKGWSLDLRNGWNFLDPLQRERARKMVRTAKPGMPSFGCSQYSSLLMRRP